MISNNNEFNKSETWNTLDSAVTDFFVFSLKTLSLIRKRLVKSYT